MRFSAANWVLLSLSAVLIVPDATKADAGYTGNILFQLTPPDGYIVDGSRSMSGAAGVALGSVFDTNLSPDQIHAFLFSSTGGADLNPSGFTFSEGEATDGMQQVGDGTGPSTGNNSHALLWTGTATSAIDLNPSQLGISVSLATSVGEGQQAGYGITGDGHGHALIWSGSAASAVDLNPSDLGITDSQVNGTDGLQQVGVGFGPAIANDNHALMWSGSAATAVDLNPSSLGINTSSATAVDNGAEVGEGSGPGTSNNDHALLWTGTAASAVDLNPSNLNLTNSSALATDGTYQVGYGDGPDTDYHHTALLWNGTADSAIDLQALLPAPGFNENWNSSDAFFIDSAGDIFGTAEVVVPTIGNSSFQYYYAVEWTPLPEPASITLLALSYPVLRRRRKDGLSLRAP